MMSAEPRYNLATKIMSNGVEVIVAGDRNTRPGEPEFLRLLSSTVTRPITLAPHTLSNHMSMLLPANLQSQNEVEASLRPVEEFSKATIYTTYIYPTRVLQGTKTRKTMEKVIITNVKEVKLNKNPETSSQEIKISSSPVLQTDVQKTVFTYLNTVLDGDQPLVVTSRKTVANILTHISEMTSLEPSEVFPETNTYYATREFTRTLTDGTDSQIVSTTDVVTQVVVTDPPETESYTSDQGSIDVTKTYFVTYTYFSTIIEDEDTKVTSHVSVSSDITIEKFFANAKKTLMITPTPAPLNIIVTKTYTSTLVEESETEFVKQIVTETLPPEGFPSGYLEELASKFSSRSESPIITSAVLMDGEHVEITAFQGDIIDEWYEKFKVKPTSENEITKTRLKTKTTLKHRPKTKVAPRITISSTSSTYSTSVVSTASLTPDGTTLQPGDQVIVLNGEQGHPTMIPLTDPGKKRPKNDSEVQVSDMLSLGALGINSINVLGPVFNAMADLLKTRNKETIKKRNDTIPIKKTSNINPLLHAINAMKAPSANIDQKILKATTSRVPVYIPMGTFAEDSDLSESETQINILPKPEKWVQEKWPDKQPEKNRRTHDTNPIPLLEGGIPISPGQIITTNSDVIIGRPSDSGPRPPNFAVKNNVPIDMMPPPVEESRVHLEPVGQFTVHKGVEPGVEPQDGVEMQPPPPPAQNLPRPPKNPPFHFHRPHDSGDMDLNPPPPPPSFARPAAIPIPVHLSPDEIVENYVNPVHLQPDSLAVPNELFPTPSIPREVSRLIERSSGQPLLVNIQPSQVAQVVIPHGSSTALIISGEEQHSTKGEVIDDPSPHPEPETVGFVGAEPVLKIENSEIPSHSLNAMSEILKADMLHPPNRQRPFGTAPDHISVRPRPDYDNIGMRPPNAPSHHPQYNLSKKDPNGIYVDISPPGHLPPPPDSPSSGDLVSRPQINSPDHLDNHQSGVVNDVPLNAQVQLGSGRPNGNIMKEVLVSVNSESYGNSQGNDERIHFIHRPDSDPEDLAPPPLPRPVKPIPNNHAPGHVQKLPLPHGHAPHYPNIPEPVDFMMPPPKPEYGQPILIPVGASVNGDNRGPRPGEMMVIQGSDYQNEDLYTDSNDPLQTEDGEEIQESNSRPLLPGQLPSEVEKLMRNQTDSSNIGVSQTLTFGHKNDKADDTNAPGIREPETIVGSHVSVPSSGFNSNNEAVVSVGKQPSLSSSEEMNIEEAEKMFGQKLPGVDHPHGIGINMRPDEINEILTPPKMEEVMGMAPPPVDRPRRPPSPPRRPKPPFTLDNFPPPISSHSPMNMENDFPPVRSPDLNKKPFKPEDVFPPRLPENFIHHEYEIRTQKPLRRPSVTSMPIDSPYESTFETTTEVNGHSKPVKSENGTTHNRPRPVIYERPPTVLTQKATVRPAIQDNKPPRGHVPSKVPQQEQQPPPRNPTIEHQPPRNPTHEHHTPTKTPQHDLKPPPRNPSNEYQSPHRSPPSEYHSPSRKPAHEHQPPSRNTPPDHQPPQRGPTPDHQQPPRTSSTGSDSQKPKQPQRGNSQPDSKRENHPFPFDGPQGVEDMFTSFGDKMRNPGQPNGNSPPRQPPSRGPPANFDPPRYEQPPPRVQTPPTYQQPPRGRPTSPHKNQHNLYEPPPPIAFERPPSRQPPSEFIRPPTEQPLPKPPSRVEPSPHFEGRPVQGAPTTGLSNQHLQMGETSHPVGVSRKPPPAYLKPPNRDEPPKDIDQQPQPTTVDNPSRDVYRRNQTTVQIKYPQVNLKPQSGVATQTVKPAFEIPPFRNPTRGRPPPFKPTPTVKPKEELPLPGLVEGMSLKPTSTRDASVEISTTRTKSGPNIVTSMVTSGSTTIFGDLYTEPLLLHPTRVITSNQGVQFTAHGFPQEPINSAPPEKIMVVSSIFPTHATTLTVTSTMTTVLHGVGQTPVTRTVLLTTTIISTIVDKVTETETLVKPTTSTVTQTHTISTTRTALVVPTAIYPPRHKYPMPKPEIFVADVHDNRPKPGIFVADPHDKTAKPEIFVADPRDKDTITISVSSSMSKKDHKEHKDSVDGESILVVVSDKPPPSGGSAEVHLSGVLSPPTYPRPTSTTECLPECRATRNELCVKQEGLMKCVCRPGFARMFPDRPCKPTYTYSMQVAIDRMGEDTVQYQNGLHLSGSPKYLKVAEAAKEGLNRVVMQSDLRDIYHGVAITGFQPKEKKTMVDFYVQLSENVEEAKVLGVFKKSLRNSNFSLGGTEMFAARESDNVHIQDFNECLNQKFHDCSEHARCFNLKGTYTCSCKEGFTDVSENSLYPGRHCSDIIGCEYCGYHGTCYIRNEQQTCECFQWYTGDRCRINLKVLLIALVTIGAILLTILLICVVLTCLKRRSTTNSHSNGSNGYLRYRGPAQSLDKRAMIVDTSSESSVENLPYVNPPPPPPPQPTMAMARKPVLRQIKRPAPRPQGPPADQRDRSLTVMIPRVKYRAVPPLSPHMTMSTFSPDKHLSRTAAQVATEQKLISYLDGGQREGQTSQRPSKEDKRIYEPKPIPHPPAKKEARVFEYEYKTSNMNITDGTSSGERQSKDDRFRRYSDQTPLHHEHNNMQHRKYSAGALVSAGYAVSATGGIIHDVEESTIHSNTLKSNRSQFTTLNRSGDHKTMSEARSYDETMIHPQTRPLCTNYSGSSSSRLNHDENHTMVERDLGSTFLLPESHLFKPAGDRGSDISNFDSL